jgi:hypothetical protein
MNRLWEKVVVMYYYKSVSTVYVFGSAYSGRKVRGGWRREKLLFPFRPLEAL